MMGLKTVSGTCLFLLAGGSFAENKCDFSHLRAINQIADQAYPKQSSDPGARRQFSFAMRTLLDLNRKGCALPKEDPDSVLFRSR